MPSVIRQAIRCAKLFFNLVDLRDLKTEKDQIKQFAENDFGESRANSS
jgi:hypothetical protein